MHPDPRGTRPSGTSSVVDCDITPYGGVCSARGLGGEWRRTSFNLGPSASTEGDSDETGVKYHPTSYVNHHGQECGGVRSGGRRHLETFEPLAFSDTGASAFMTLRAFRWPACVREDSYGRSMGTGVEQTCLQPVVAHQGRDHRTLRGRLKGALAWCCVCRMANVCANGSCEYCVWDGGREAQGNREKGPPPHA